MRAEREGYMSSVERPDNFSFRRNFPGLRRIARLSQEEFEQVRVAIASTEPAYPARVFADRVAAKVSLDRPAASAIINTLGPIYVARAEVEQSIPDFVGSVTVGLVREETDETLKALFEGEQF